MELCNKCGKIGEIVKPGLRCRKCCNEYKNQWSRKKNNRICSFCNEKFIPNSPAKECSLKCKLLNRIKKINECWEWQGKIIKIGYGEITHERKYMLAHRCSYRTFKGEIPKGMHICHTCDNKKCINPDHLWIGTQQENILDAMNKGRLPLEKNFKQRK